MRRSGVLLTSIMLLDLVLPSAAFAYAGPGSGMTALGSALALVGGIILAIIGFAWYPIKRLLRRFGLHSKAGTPTNDLTQ